MIVVLAVGELFSDCLLRFMLIVVDGLFVHHD